jgi:heme-degrading monooxygenase HmoA
MVRSRERRKSMGQAVATWASGSWSVSSGKENEFIDRWRDWLEWSRDNVTGFRSATLIRDEQNDNHFISFSDWEDVDSRERWKNSDGFQQKFAACRELCDGFQGGDFGLAVSV